MTNSKTFRAIVAVVGAFAAMLVLALPANAGGVFYGRWNGSSIGYVYWGSTCNGIPNNQANLNFAGGVTGGNTYIRNVYVVNGTDRVMRFTRGIRLLGSNGGPIVDKPVPDLPPRNSVRIDINTTFSGTRLTSVFYPYIGWSHPDVDCGQTFTQIDP